MLNKIREEFELSSIDDNNTASKLIANDEIKEILDYLHDKDNYIEELGVAYKRIYINNGDLSLLLDYITNLQQENERLRIKCDLLTGKKIVELDKKAKQMKIKADLVEKVE